MSQCLSCLGPPPHCGHVPTNEAPFCRRCEDADASYRRHAHGASIQRSIQILRAAGYTIIAPKDNA